MERLTKRMQYNNAENTKEALAIIGILITGSSDVFPEFEENIVNYREVLEYLEKLDLDYEFVKDIINDDYGSVFYHKEPGMNSVLLPEEYNKKELCRSEHDHQIWVDENGRLGVWCEVDGFVAWLDEYSKVWTVDSREEIAEHDKEFEKKLNKIINLKFNKLVNKAFKDCFKIK